ncbi:hypothetical protein PG993_015215 [Apiospora rasikravindrae]|uniref:DUF3072 domain-containing protein n=1 Tax=Apiospora rasikravindrae TaxID=990691 RepID=A0ABR1RPX5_9PEZI
MRPSSTKPRPRSAPRRPPEPDVAAKVESQDEAAKDLVDDALPKGPKKADASTGGRVQVGETGDLKELAAERHES